MHFILTLITKSVYYISTYWQYSLHIFTDYWYKKVLDITSFLFFPFRYQRHAIACQDLQRTSLSSYVSSAMLGSTNQLELPRNQSFHTMYDKSPGGLGHVYEIICWKV